MDKEGLKNETLDPILGTKRKQFSHHYKFSHSPEIGLLEGAPNIPN